MSNTIITGDYYADTAYTFRDSGYTYEQYDCAAFTNLVRTTCGLQSISRGTNTMWRSRDLWWKGTIDECNARWGAIPKGALIFRCHPETDPDYNIPPSSPYYMDGIGDFSHVGIRTYLGQGVMQSGGYGGTGVHQSGYRADYWTHVGLPINISYDGFYPVDPLPPKYFITIIANQRKELLKNAKRWN